MAAPTKVLFAGDPRGSHAALAKRVQAVNSKSGPFAALFCVGPFFAAAGGEKGAVPDELKPYMQGTAQPPVPIHFIGGWGQGSAATLEALQQAGTSAAGLSYLGRAGVTTIHGLNVAFLDGTFSQQHWGSDPATQGPCCRHYTEADVALLKRQLASSDGEIDLLLTCEWPTGLTQGLPPHMAALPGYDARSGSQVVTELAQLARPRYHIAGGQGLFYTRPPYINKDLGAGTRATRFVGLGAVVNDTKQKFLHALALVPASDMAPEQLSQQPEGATPSPYEGEAVVGAKRRAEEELPDGSDWRWQQVTKRQRQERQPATPWGNPDIPKAPHKTVYVKNLPFPATWQDVEQFFSSVGKVVDIRRGVDDKGRLHGWAHVLLESEEAAKAALQLTCQQLLGRELFVDLATSGAKDRANFGKAVENCWFCLSSPEVDINLVASVGDESYVALDKGAITPQHVLVVPIEHFPSSMAAPEGCYDEMQRYLSALKACYAAQGLQLVAFERYLTLRGKGGNHCHINAIGISRAAGAGARQVFEQQGAEAGLTFTHIPAVDGKLERSAVRDVVGDGEYFMGLLPDGSALVHRVSRGDRCMHLGRQILATLAGVPERADWRQCSSAPEEEVQRTDGFKELFKPYDIMQQ